MNISGIEACHADLFTDIEELERKYPPDTVAKILRVRDCYMMLLRTPSMTDAALIKTMTARHKISRPTAYNDLSVVKTLLPMLSQESREFHRWREREMLLETYKIAAAKMDVRTMERVASTYAKVFHVDKDDEEKLPLDKIIVQPWTPTDDPSTLGILPMENRQERIDALLEEFRAKDPEIIDVQFEEADI